MALRALDNNRMSKSETSAQTTLLANGFHPTGANRANGEVKKPVNGTANQASLSSAYRKTAEAVSALSVLSPKEQKDLIECETVIDRGWQTFVEVGRALA